MRLRSLRKLEEIELKKERTKLINENNNLKLILKDKNNQFKEISNEIKQVKKELGDKTKRITTIENQPKVTDVNIETYVEKEPITIVLSKQNWIRSHKGHLDLFSDLRYREGDNRKFVIHAYTTDKILLFTENGFFYTLKVSQLPSGRGIGEPLSKILDINNNEIIIKIFSYFDSEIVIASNDGLGFIVPTKNLLASTKSGKKILNLNDNAKAQALSTCDGDLIAVVGQNRKMLIFSIDDLPKQSKGKGVILQRYKDGLLSDIKIFKKEEGINWYMQGGRQRSEKDITSWIGKRGSIGKLVPNGFPRPPKFD